MFKMMALLILFSHGEGTIRAVWQQAPEELNARLARRVNTYNLIANSFVEALSKAATEFQIPMGITWVNKPAATGKLSLSWVGASVQEIIEEIAATQAGYQVRVSNGVVHISSPEIPPKQNFLLVRINKFAANHQPLPYAMRNLQDLVRLTVAPPSNQHSDLGQGSSTASNTDEPKIDLELDHASVEEILDSLLKVSARKVWIATFEEMTLPSVS